VVQLAAECSQVCQWQHGCCSAARRWRVADAL